MKKIITAILKILLYAGIFSTLLPLVFFALFKRNGKQDSLRVIFIYALYCAINEGMTFYLQSIRSATFRFFIYAFTIIEYSFFCYFVYLVLTKKKIKKTIFYIWLGFVLFSIIDLFYVNEGHGFDSFTSGIESIIIILICSYYLVSHIRGSNNLSIYSTFDFWIIITFLIYFSGTFFLYLMTDKMMQSSYFRELYIVINSAFNIFKNILLSVAMTMKLNEVININLKSKTFPKLDEDILFMKKK